MSASLNDSWSSSIGSRMVCRIAILVMAWSLPSTVPLPTHKVQQKGKAGSNYAKVSLSTNQSDTPARRGTRRADRVKRAARTCQAGDEVESAAPCCVAFCCDGSRRPGLSLPRHSRCMQLCMVGEIPVAAVGRCGALPKWKGLVELVGEVYVEFPTPSINVKEDRRGQRYFAR